MEEEGDTEKNSITVVGTASIPTSHNDFIPIIDSEEGDKEAINSVTMVRMVSNPTSQNEYIPIIRTVSEIGFIII